MICGLGYDPAAFIAFQTTQRVRVPRFVESFEILRALMSGDDVTYQGRHYTINQGIRINPKPLQQTLPMWIAAGAEPAVRRGRKDGGRMDDCARLGSAVDKGAAPKHTAAHWRSSAGQRSPNEVVLRRDIHLAPTSEAASREAATLFEHGYRGQSAGELQQSLVVGGPAECIETAGAV